MAFLHGVEVVEVDAGARPVRTVDTGVIGLVGTAAKGPINIPILVAGSRREAVEAFGPADGKGTIPAALAGIFDQVGAKVVVVNVLRRSAAGPGEDAAFAGGELRLGDDAATPPLDVEDLVITNRGETVTYEAGTHYTLDPVTGEVKVITEPRPSQNAIPADGLVKVSYSYLGNGAADDIVGGADGKVYTGVSALLQASARGLPKPKILVAPQWSREKTVADALDTVAGRLRAVAVVDGPSTTDAAAKTEAAKFDSRRLYFVDPAVLVGSPPRAEPASARVAGVIARSDAERGFWASPSNRPVAGVAGTARPVDFELGDPASRANILNEARVATVVHRGGYRLWGNRSTATDARWQFLSVARTADAIDESILRSHAWAVDRNITKSYLADVAEGVNAYLRELVGRGAILGGRAWIDPELNTAATFADGKVVVSFDFTPPAPAERITFRSELVDDYLKELV